LTQEVPEDRQEEQQVQKRVQLALSGTNKSHVLKISMHRVPLLKLLQRAGSHAATLFWPREVLQTCSAVSVKGAGHELTD
jgi:hypothetical protein